MQELREVRLALEAKRLRLKDDEKLHMAAAKLASNRQRNQLRRTTSQKLEDNKGPEKLKC